MSLSACTQWNVILLFQCPLCFLLPVVATTRAAQTDSTASIWLPQRAWNDWHAYRTQRHLLTTASSTASVWLLYTPASYTWLLQIVALDSTCHFDITFYLITFLNTKRFVAYSFSICLNPQIIVITVVLSTDVLQILWLNNKREKEMKFQSCLIAGLCSVLTAACNLSAAFAHCTFESWISF